MTAALIAIVRIHPPICSTCPYLVRREKVLSGFAFFIAVIA